MTKLNYQERLAEENKGIPTSEIKQDILDTQTEIVTMQREIKGFRLINDKLSNFRADARKDGIASREIFIKKLQAILEVRRNYVK